MLKKFTKNIFSNNPDESSNATLATELKNHQIDYIRVVWCDNAGIIRAKAMHRDHFINQHQQGVGISFAQQAIPYAQDTVVPNSGLEPVGEAQLIPDLSTLHQLSYSAGHARCIGNMVVNKQPWSYCPRYFLKRQLARARKLQLEFKTAFENEFYLFAEEGGVNLPLDHTAYAASCAIDFRQEFLKDLTNALLSQNIQPLVFHAEAGPSQYELSIAADEPLVAADQQIAFREAVYAIAHQYGLIGTFIPKPFKDDAGSGSHLHLSLIHKDKPLSLNHTETSDLPKIAAEFIAGIYHHLPSLMLITSPTPNAYRRFVPHAWSGAYQIIGTQNREAAIRLIPQGKESHLEIKPIDGTCNPYLTLGCIIAAGLDGIEKQMTLPEFINFDPGNLTKKALKKKNIKPLPDNLGSSLNQFKHNTVLKEALGEELAKAIIATRSYDWNFFKNRSFADEVSILLEKF